MVIYNKIKKVWNKGLNKYNNNVLKLMSDKGKERWNNKEWADKTRNEIRKGYTIEVKKTIADYAKKQKRLQHLTEEHKKKLSISLRKTFSNNPEINIKKSNNMKGEKNHYYNKKHNKIIRQKIKEGIASVPLETRMRLNQKSREFFLEHISWQKNNGLPVSPIIGKKEKEFLDNLENNNNIKIVRQYPIMGFYIDGYIPELNLSIEYDEKHHRHKIERDIIRQKLIEEKLNCKFIRVKEGEENRNIIENFSLISMKEE